jgi:hypothetical protein
MTALLILYLQQAVVEITYKTKVKIFAKIYEKKDWESILKPPG